MVHFLAHKHVGHLLDHIFAKNWALDWTGFVKCPNLINNAKKLSSQGTFLIKDMRESEER